MLDAPTFLSGQVAPDLPGLRGMEVLRDPALAARRAVIDPAQSDDPIDPSWRCLPHVLQAALDSGGWGSERRAARDALRADWFRSGRSDQARTRVVRSLAWVAEAAGEVARADLANEVSTMLAVVRRSAYLPDPGTEPLVSGLLDVMEAGGVPCGWRNSDPDDGPWDPARDLAFLVRP